MFVTDYIIIFLVLISFYRGFKKGIVLQLIDIFTLLFSFYLIINYAQKFGSFINLFYNIPSNIQFLIGGIAIFIIAIIIKKLIYNLLISKIVKGFFDSLIGSIFSILKLLIFLIVILFVFEKINIFDRKIIYNNSIIFSKLEKIVTTIPIPSNLK